MSRSMGSADGDQTRRNFLKLAGTGLGVSLAGCSDTPYGSDGGATSAEPVDAEPVETSGDGADTPEERGEDEFIFLNDTAIDNNLDPALHKGSLEMMIFFNMYETLIWFDKTNSPVANLATGWEREDGGQTWVFDIRQGVKTHDGNELTADDFVYSLDRYLKIGLGLSGHFSGIYESAEARDDYTLAITLQNAFQPFINWCILAHAVDSTVVIENEQDGDFGERGDYGQSYLAENSAGTGPYQLDHWDRGEELVYDKFDDYWQGWEPNQFDSVTQLIVPEESTQKIMMEQGDADMTTDQLSFQTYEDLGSNDHINHISQPVIRLNYYITNTQKPPLDDRIFRKAVAHVVDYEVLRNNIYGSMVPITGCIPDILPGSNDDLEPYEYNEEKAREALEASQYTADQVNNEMEELVARTFAGSQDSNDAGLLLQQGLREVLGIELTIKETGFSEIVASWADPETNPHFTPGLANTADFPNHNQYTRFMWHPDNTTDNTGHPAGANYWTDPEVTEILDEIQETQDREKRLELYGEVERLVTEAYASIFVGSAPVNYAMNASVGGFTYRGAQATERRVYNKPSDIVING